MPRSSMLAPLGRAALLCLSAVLTGGCSLVLDFSEPPDAAPIDAAVTEAQCQAQEPNDDPATAKDIAPGELMAAICGGGESDYYRVTIAANQQLTVTIAFMNRGGAGDLDLRLMSNDAGMSYDDSTSSSDSERVMCPGGRLCPGTSLPAGMYLVQVHGSLPSVQSAYTLTYTLTGP